jgi:glycosyltransferase involved in cell wall biosynthesis
VRRIALVATHPIQYQVPWFQALARRPEVDLRVYFGMLPDANQQGIGFGVPFNWDIPLLEGYAWERLPNARAHPRLGRFFGSSTPAIAERMREWKPDAVIITGWNAAPLAQALVACRRLGIPAIVRGESNALRRRPLAVRLAHRALLRQFAAFLAIGKANAAFYRGYGIEDSRIFEAPYFVDNDRFRAAADSLAPGRGELRRRWSIPPEATCFAFVGKMEPKKRPQDLVEALARVPASRRAHALFVGSGVLEGEVREAARAKGVGCSFAGFLNQSEIPAAYAACDCLVLPSDFGETWGLVVNEAMACGRPALVSDRVGCGPDLVEPGATGEIFRFADASALASAMESMCDPGRRTAFGRAAQRRVLEAYNVERTVEGTLAAVDAAVR